MLFLKKIGLVPAGLLLLAAILLYICSLALRSAPSQQQPPGEPPAAQYHKLSPEEAQAMMESAESYVLLDVRTQEEYQAQRIPGAVLIPDFDITARAEEELPDKAALILVYCRSGRRSANAAQALVAMGYWNVYDFGGIMDWPYETE